MIVAAIILNPRARRRRKQLEEAQMGEIGGGETGVTEGNTSSGERPLETVQRVESNRRRQTTQDLAVSDNA